MVNALTVETKPVYTLKSTGHGSTRFGNCEVCGRHCAEVFVQGKDRTEYTFGHDKCLKASR
jgi:hypothetical protein